MMIVSSSGMFAQNDDCIVRTSSRVKCVGLALFMQA